MMVFRVVQCSDPSLWYADRIGDVFVCTRMERLTGGDILWTRNDTSEFGSLLNWVWAKDAEEVN